jgi:ribosome-associated translation inhibitor RaiA
MRSSVRKGLSEPGLDLEVMTSGRPAVDPSTIAYAKKKIARAAESAPAPVLFGRIKLGHEPHRSIERPSTVEAMLDVDGRAVRVHVAAGTMREAIDIAEERLRRQLTDIEHRIAFLRRRLTGISAPGEWRHEDVPADRPRHFPRPVDERQIVRRKTFALAAMAPDEAIVEMQMLDHDFYLFVQAGTGKDAIISRLPDGTFELSTTAAPEEALEPDVPIALAREPVSTRTEDEAAALLDAGDEPFVFFIDPTSSRGEVVYRRYDGHYGIVTSTEESP